MSQGGLNLGQNRGDLRRTQKAALGLETLCRDRQEIAALHSRPSFLRRLAFVVDLEAGAAQVQQRRDRDSRSVLACIARLTPLLNEAHRPGGAGSQRDVVERSDTAPAHRETKFFGTNAEAI